MDATPLALNTHASRHSQPILLWQTPRRRYRRSPPVHSETICVHISSGIDPTRICPMTRSLRIRNTDPPVTTGMDIIEQRQQLICAADIDFGVGRLPTATRLA